LHVTASVLLVKHQSRKVSFLRCFHCTSSLVCGQNFGEELSFVRDKGFVDSKAVTPHQALGDAHKPLRRAISVIRSRQETANWCVKKWNAMSHFRHHRSKHHLLFRAMLIIAQIEIENGSPIFQVKGCSHPAHMHQMVTVAFCLLAVLASLFVEALCC